MLRLAIYGGTAKDFVAPAVWKWQHNASTYTQCANCVRVCWWYGNSGLVKDIEGCVLCCEAFEGSHKHAFFEVVEFGSLP